MYKSAKIILTLTLASQLIISTIAAASSASPVPVSSVSAPADAAALRPTASTPSVPVSRGPAPAAPTAQASAATTQTQPDFITFGEGPKGRSAIDKSKDKKLQALLAETVPQFKQYSYLDKVSGRTINYNLFVPAGYKKDQSYPLLMFIGDASTVGADTTIPLQRGYSPAVWAAASSQAKQPCLVLVPQYNGVVIDDHNGFKVTPDVEATARLVQTVARDYGADEKRLYSTGQSMGCMITLYLAAKHPDLFAATLLVSGQWDIKDLAPLARQKFFYLAAGGDPKASQGQRELLSLLQQQGAKVSTASWDARKSEAALSRAARREIAAGNPINFATFVTGSVLPAGVKSNNEHMYSFDHAYQISAVREWLLAQHK